MGRQPAPASHHDLVERGRLSRVVGRRRFRRGPPHRGGRRSDLGRRRPAAHRAALRARRHARPPDREPGHLDGDGQSHGPERRPLQHADRARRGPRRRAVRVRRLRQSPGPPLLVERHARALVGPLGCRGRASSRSSTASRSTAPTGCSSAIARTTASSSSTTTAASSASGRTSTARPMPRWTGTASSTSSSRGIRWASSRTGSPS